MKTSRKSKAEREHWSILMLREAGQAKRVARLEMALLAHTELFRAISGKLREVTRLPTSDGGFDDVTRLVGELDLDELQAVLAELRALRRERRDTRAKLITQGVSVHAL